MFFNSIIMLRFGKKKVAKEEIYGAKKKKKKDVNVDNVVTSKLMETKAKYLIGSLDEI